MSEIGFACPQCQQPLSVEGSAAGMTAQCLVATVPRHVAQRCMLPVLLFLVSICSAGAAEVTVTNDLPGLQRIYTQHVALIENKYRAVFSNEPARLQKDLDAIEKKYQQAGDLKTVLAIRQVRDAVKKVPSGELTVEPTDPPDLRALKEEHNSIQNRVEIDMTRDMNALAKGYITRLEELKKQLTIKARIEKAVDVQTEIEVVTAGMTPAPGDQRPAPPSTTARSPAAQVDQETAPTEGAKDGMPAKATPEPTDGTGQPERSVAEDAPREPAATADAGLPGREPRRVKTSEGDANTPLEAPKVDAQDPSRSGLTILRATYGVLGKGFDVTEKVKGLAGPDKLELSGERGMLLGYDVAPNQPKFLIVEYTAGTNLLKRGKATFKDGEPVSIGLADVKAKAKSRLDVSRNALTIIKATYGRVDRGFDVTKKVKELAGPDKLELPAHPAHLFGDVAPGEVKLLIIEYTVGTGLTKRGKKTFKEGEPVIIP